jgi:hypothetical protein
MRATLRRISSIAEVLRGATVAKEVSLGRSSSSPSPRPDALAAAEPSLVELLGDRYKIIPLSFAKNLKRVAGMRGVVGKMA